MRRGFIIYCVNLFFNPNVFKPAWYPFLHIRYKIEYQSRGDKFAEIEIAIGRIVSSY